MGNIVEIKGSFTLSKKPHFVETHLCFKGTMLERFLGVMDRQFLIDNNFRYEDDHFRHIYGLHTSSGIDFMIIPNDPKGQPEKGFEVIFRFDNTRPIDIDDFQKLLYLFEPYLSPKQGLVAGSVEDEYGEPQLNRDLYVRQT